MSHPPRRLAAGYILYRETAKGRRYLLLKASNHGEWGFPKGHADPGETPLSTAMRECAEECGIALLQVTGAPALLDYTTPNRGPKRVVYYPAVTCQERVTLSHEHAAADWCKASTVCRRLNHASLIRLFRDIDATLGKDA